MSFQPSFCQPVILSSHDNIIQSSGHPIIMSFQHAHGLTDWLTHNIRVYRSASQTIREGQGFPASEGGGARDRKPDTAHNQTSFFREIVAPGSGKCFHSNNLEIHKSSSSTLHSQTFSLLSITLKLQIITLERSSIKCCLWSCLWVKFEFQTWKRRRVVAGLLSCRPIKTKICANLSNVSDSWEKSNLTREIEMIQTAERKDMSSGK